MEKEKDYLMKLLYIPLGTFISLLMVSGIIGSINHLSKTSGLKDEYDRELNKKQEIEKQMSQYNEKKWKLISTVAITYLINLLDAYLVLKHDEQKKEKEQLRNLGFNYVENTLIFSYNLRF